MVFVARKKGINEIVFNLPDERSFEIKAKKLIRIIKANEELEEGFLEALVEQCPSAASFIELFAWA